MQMSIQTAAFPLAVGFSIARARAAESMDVIVVEGFVGDTVIGVHTSEHSAQQPVRTDVGVGVPRLFACSTDRLDDTIDYGRIRDFLRDLLAPHPHRLLQALAVAMAPRRRAGFG